MLNVIILAAGKGTRMRSELPKVLHTLAGKPFLQHVIDRAQELNAANIYVVVGHGAGQVKAAVTSENITFIEQTEQLGTGHAVAQVLPELSKEGKSLILYGDVPLIASDTLSALAANAEPGSLGLLTMDLADPFGYGRILRDVNGSVTGVVEQKDASTEQQQIKEVNTGFLAVRNQDLHRWLPMLSSENAQQEYLLPDIIALAHDEGISIQTAQPREESEVMGVNNRRQQAELERIYQASLANALMEQGLALLDPSRFDCRGELSVGNDCVIDIGCVFEGEVILGDRVHIGPNCHIKDARIGDDTTILSHTVIDRAIVGADANIGPFARLRPNATLADCVKVGNFVEIKKANVGEGSKVNHLSYIGDAKIGSGVNIGAGTITCNYDGKNKFVTTIGDDVFIGSNSALVAPLTINEKATIAAGSVITSDISENSLGVGRARQRIVEDWGKRKK